MVSSERAIRACVSERRECNFLDVTLDLYLVIAHVLPKARNRSHGLLAMLNIVEKPL